VSLRNLVALESGLNSVSPCNIPNGLIYAQELLKLGSMEPDDAEAWLQFNWQAYPYKLTHAVISQVVHSESSRKKQAFKDILASLDQLYDVPPDDSALATIEGKFSSMSSMVRRGFTATSSKAIDTTSAAGGSTPTKGSGPIPTSPSTGKKQPESSASTESLR
jgi:hypothetical protein